MPGLRPGGRVVLLHGIGRTGRSMRPLARHLASAGHAPVVPSYPWRRGSIDWLADWLGGHLAASGIWDGAGPVHFVTHSMGGLVAARYLERAAPALPPDRLGRVVMLGPPHGGSEVADALSGFPPYRWLYGAAGQDLVTTRTPGVAAYPLGIIAGSVGWPYLLGNLLLEKPHDGRVSVRRTELPGMADHLVLPVSHTPMPGHPLVLPQVEHFLRLGRFWRSGE